MAPQSFRQRHSSSIGRIHRSRSSSPSPKVSCASINGPQEELYYFPTRAKLEAFDAAWAHTRALETEASFSSSSEAPKTMVKFSPGAVALSKAHEAAGATYHHLGPSTENHLHLSAGAVALSKSRKAAALNKTTIRFTARAVALSKAREAAGTTCTHLEPIQKNHIHFSAAVVKRSKARRLRPLTLNFGAVAALGAEVQLQEVKQESPPPPGFDSDMEECKYCR